MRSTVGSPPSQPGCEARNPRVERTVQCGRSNFFSGEQFAGLADVCARGAPVCAGGRAAGARHDPGQARDVFVAKEVVVLVPRPAAYDVPTFALCKVHRDIAPMTAVAGGPARSTYRMRYRRTSGKRATSRPDRLRATCSAI
jgi:hypothetical protein